MTGTDAIDVIDAADPGAVVAALASAGAERRSPVGLAIGDGSAALVCGADRRAIAVARAGAAVAAVVAAVEAELEPRWVWWSNETAATLVAHDVRVGACWDVAAVHRLLAGGWAAEPDRIWAWLHDLPRGELPTTGPLDLFSHAAEEAADAGDPEDPVRPDGYLRPAWVTGGWRATVERTARWAALAREAADLQDRRVAALAREAADLQGHRVAALDHPERARAAIRSESAADLLAAELAADGLPIDRAAMEAAIGGHIGPRPATPADADRERARRDREVLRHLPPDAAFDLRSPGQVKSLLRRVGIEVPDTRAWRLEPLRDAHPVVPALLTWRRAERIETTYGYRWLDEHVGPDGRLRGTWTGSDGAAGRMTASAGLHNLPTDLRRGVVAEPGHVFVRADLGQIEPRVLAVVSGDDRLAVATGDDDLYTPIADQLGVDRPTAKVAMLGAMYGQTSGRGAEMQQRLRRSFPTAMAFLAAADRAGRAGRSIRTYGGRLVHIGPVDAAMDERAARARAGAMGRYARNAVVQGAAAELFKVWAALVRARAAPLGARIVLCLHDELLVHAPADRGDDVAAVVLDCLDEAAHRWAGDARVRFVADTRVLRCWADAK